MAGLTAEEAEVVRESASTLFGRELAVLAEFAFEVVRGRRGRRGSVVGLLLVLLLRRGVRVSGRRIITIVVVIAATRSSVENHSRTPRGAEKNRTSLYYSRIPRGENTFVQ